MEKSEQISTSVTPETKQKIRVTAAEEGRQMSDWLRDAIHEKMDRENESGNRRAGEQPAD